MTTTAPHSESAPPQPISDSRSDSPTQRTGIERLFTPTSVAVVGASMTPGKLGNAMIEALTSSGDHRPQVYGINPRAEAPNFHPDLAAATAAHGAPLDLAILCIPASACPETVAAAAAAGVGAVLICSGGFAEAGDEGVAVQRQIADIATQTGIRVLGPNTSGFFAPGRLVASFVPTVAQLRPGRVAVVAASGGVNHAMSFLLSESGIGVGFGVGLGNCVDVTAVDVLRHVGADPDIDAIALHVESVTDGVGLLAAVRAVSAHTPVVALVVGRSDVSAFSASHTGALATSWRTTRALLAQAGAVVVDTDSELVHALATLSTARLTPRTNPGVGIVTAQAGPGLMVLDALQVRGASVPELSQHSIDELATVLPPLTFQANPVDTGRPGPGFDRVLAITAADPAVDVVALYCLAEPGAVDVVSAIGASGTVGNHPVVAGIGGPREMVEQTRVAAAQLGVAVLDSPTALAVGVDALVRDARQQALLHADTDRADAASVSVPIAEPQHEAQVKDILDGLGIATPARRVCADRSAAHRALGELELPVAAKILDATILHKTEIGGVHLNITDATELDIALDALDAAGAAQYLIESMAPSGIDLIVGARRDPVFGPIVLAGIGGTAAEAIGDVAIAGADLTTAAASVLLDELQCAALLDGWRGGPVLDRGAFAAAITAIGAYLRAHLEIAEIEINPLRVGSGGLTALDAVLVLDTTADADTATATGTETTSTTEGRRP